MSRLKAIGVSDAILDKIIETPPDRMTYLTIEDLQQMGVEVTDNPSPSPLPKTVIDEVWLASAMTRAEIRMDNGAVIPRGSVVATMSYMPKEDTRDSSQYSVCFAEREGLLSVYRRCNISYHSPSEGTILTARVPETTLMLIEQGWSLPDGWIVVEDDLHLREYADPHAPDVLAAPHNTMPGGSVVQSNSTQECKVWMGSGRGTRDADNIWCPVQYGHYRGWANGYLLAMSDGRRVACVFYPDAKGCPAKEDGMVGGWRKAAARQLEGRLDLVRHDRPCDVAQDHPEKFNWNPGGGNAVMFGGCGEVEDTPGREWPGRGQWWSALSCGYFAYRERKNRDANPYSNEHLKEGWEKGWDEAAKACKSGKLPFSAAPAGPSYAQPLRSTSIPSSLADDEKRLMPEVMNEFYGSFDKEKACWMSKHKEGEYEGTYCMKPIRLDVINSAGRKMIFIVAGGHQVNEDGSLAGGHPTSGGLGLIVLTPNGANLGVVATNDLYEWFGSYNSIPQYDTVTIHRLGPNGTYGWLAKSGEDHSGVEHEWVKVYGVLGHSVEPLTTITTLFSSGEASGCGEEGQEHCGTLSVKYLFETHSSATSFYPIMLQAWGNYHGHPFRGSYHMVFDKSALTYLSPQNMPDEIKPEPYIVLPEAGTLSLACKGTGSFGYEQKGSIGIIVNFTTRTVQFGISPPVTITGLDDARVAFGNSESGIIGTIDRMTGDAQVTAFGNTAYSLQCNPVQ